MQTFRQRIRAFSAGFRLIAAMSYLCFAVTGCYRYRLTPEAEKDLTRIEELEASGRTDEACRMAGEKINSSAATLRLAGNCLESKTGASPDAAREAISLYQSAARCGSQEAREDLTRLNQKLPEVKCAAGETSVLLFDSRPDNCGLEREITTIGWVAAPVGIPAYFAVGAVAVGIAAAFLGAALVLCIFGGCSGGIM
jgi:hypothetical protein